MRTIILATMAALFLGVVTFSGCSTESSPDNIAKTLKSSKKK